ncbi:MULTISPECIES: metal ABC transporter solute-binding protein, Zn/Mn family [unclassified Mycolicibacterium]|uniref:metal ABC transporter solute-binding protein, Zn/Mn family n=1 Tax=unclassified Mycolicibacterium TaxID=2636767 RepID=UPI0012DED094|nr:MULTISPECIES: zinc ABC transporter substrate-binding protein [unclassified Mycolicibacterium]MUL84071.1 ABC transporter substrate-binding protein [Mycolicibacterium sp. CBMA 329]MUL89863.1 ABC transporter substrate-binding protein [Mycolicibacterium sp. CBMA 331]MUM00040.1 ABC transporter substrate-binding protein [Mycolicibacterium sp. CBMA 334]MUM28955.1 ABC transporter substrate-binding protein [Mycolicibacterium sp. CBMA 295]MUM39378.1 ABC transporter substrate-binding protein [Mycolici
MQTVIVIAVPLSPLNLRVMASGLLLVTPFALGACGSGESTDAQSSGNCPVAPVNVVVSVDQWGDIVSALGGDCAKVTTVVSGSSVDPHDFEPAPADAAKFQGAQLIVINGGHYDEWASKLAQSTAPNAIVISAVGQSDEGSANPHAWYNPAAVTGVADTLTEELGQLAPQARDYFVQRRSEFATSMQPYQQLIADIKTKAGGKRYAATEAVFDDMAAAVGLVNQTPAGYQAASSNHADPSPADLDAFLRLLADHGVDVLIYNTQTEGSVPSQIRSAAERAGVPVVDVTETVAPGADSFEAWQVDQLNALAKALHIQP